LADVTVSARKFENEFACLNQDRALSISFLDFLRAGLTFGLLDLANFSGASARRHRFRLTSALAAAEFLTWNSPRLCLEADFRHLDQTEKGVISFWLGSIFTKLVTEEHLGIPWLAHAALLIQSGVLEISPTTRKQPDFAGLDLARRWHVVESKGRSSRVNSKLFETAKKQMRPVATVEGAPPATKVVCAIHVARGRTSIILEDPPVADTASQSWKLDERAFLRHYYSGIREFLESSARSKYPVGDRAFVMAPLNDPLRNGPWFGCLQHPGKVQIGLLAEIFDTPETAPQAIRGLERRPGFGLDGIAVVIDE
jgi:hypothetical protein